MITEKGDDYLERIEASSKQQTRKADTPKYNSNASAVNPYLNGNSSSNSKSSSDRNDRNYKGGSKSVNPYI